ncbi:MULTISPECIES: DUF3040 domain-containing protein [Amycolatopsis]|uniref:DUF3040 domain-containing protein n=1 Tax=Amycolatopsis TaxID=1813 RepID=UPI000B8B539D|nr:MULTISPECIES: DUF3040 domain-containing protein [Amycolatopsis]OXM75138.1 hypothetical protein CF166_00650 [Amycolatopsis sp. KNN50.9b]
MLSEYERQRLQAIAQTFAREDPWLARRLTSPAETVSSRWPDHVAHAAFLAVLLGAATLVFSAVVALAGLVIAIVACWLWRSADLSDERPAPGEPGDGCEPAG